MTRNKSYNKTASLVLCGLFAALTAICAYINIPLGFTPIPMNLAMLAVFLSGGILGKKYGTVSIIVYVLMGAAGLPVFAGFQSGLAVIVGPTGGFLAGYIATAFIVGFSLDIYEKRHTMSQNPHRSGGTSHALCQTPHASKRRKLALCITSMFLGLIVCYALGTLWFMLLTGTGLYASLAACVLPFIPGDIIKIIAASLLTIRLRHLT